MRLAPRLEINRILYSLILLYTSLTEIVLCPLINNNLLSTMILRLSNLLI
jgi:hypothetical protein